MNESTLDDRVKIWLMNYAFRAFQHAKEASDYILSQKLCYGKPLFYPLLTSSLINYARPFKRSNLVGKISEELVPAEFFDFHLELIQLRDKLFAHSDGDGLEDEWGQINQVRYSINIGERVVSHTFELPVKSEGVEQISKLCEILISKTDYHIRKLERKHRAKFPRKNGEYVLNIDPKIDAFFLPVDPIPVSKLIASHQQK